MIIPPHTSTWSSHPIHPHGHPTPYIHVVIPPHTSTWSSHPIHPHGHPTPYIHMVISFHSLTSMWSPHPLYVVNSLPNFLMVIAITPPYPSLPRGPCHQPQVFHLRWWLCICKLQPNCRLLPQPSAPKNWSC